MRLYEIGDADHIIALSLKATCANVVLGQPSRAGQCVSFVDLLAADRCQLRHSLVTGVPKTLHILYRFVIAAGMGAKLQRVASGYWPMNASGLSQEYNPILADKSIVQTRT